jgi:hypothetical protein
LRDDGVMFGSGIVDAVPLHRCIDPSAAEYANAFRTESRRLSFRSENLQKTSDQFLGLRAVNASQKFY